MVEMWVLDGITWEELVVHNNKYGSKLIGGVGDDLAQHLGDFADQIGDHSVDESYIWTSAHRTSAGWFWGDGTPIEKSAWREGDVNGDSDPTNDTWVASLIGSHLSGDSGGVSAILYSNTGTNYRDHIIGGLDVGVTLRLLGGDDYYVGEAYGGTLDMGAGDDQVDMNDASPTHIVTIIDGDGNDWISATYATIKATADGDQDNFYTGGRITYAAGTTGIILLDTDDYWALLSSLEFGDDIVEASHVVGTNFNDRMAGANRLSGGKGDDILAPQVFAEGGDGDDYLIADSFERVELRGESGADHFVLISSAEVGGGAGLDTFLIGGVARFTINDLQAGEKIYISELHINKSDALSDGFLKQTSSGGFTRLWIDMDGGGDNWFELITAKGNVDVYDHLIF